MRVCVFTLMLGYDYLCGNYKKREINLLCTERQQSVCAQFFLKHYNTKIYKNKRKIKNKKTF